MALDEWLEAMYCTIECTCDVDTCRFVPGFMLQLTRTTRYVRVARGAALASKLVGAAWMGLS